MVPLAATITIGLAATAALAGLAGPTATSSRAEYSGRAAAPPRFTDATAALGLPEINATRLCFADLNSDARPDLIIRAIEPGKPDRYRVLLNQPAPESVIFVELSRPHGLPTPRAGDTLVFADLNSDGHADAVFARYLDINAKDFRDPDPPARTCWLKGRGDGTFVPPALIHSAQRATTSCIAIGDADRDGLLDLYLGNWYTSYGASNQAYTNDLLLQRAGTPGSPPEFFRQSLPPDFETFDESSDLAGRPCYGVMFCSLSAAPFGTQPALLDLCYGRRANRLWAQDPQHNHLSVLPLPPPPTLIARSSYRDLAPQLGLDGDAIRHGTYPDWLKERAKTDKRFDRPDELPYRSHGNTFDAAIGDINNDGDFDIFLAEITHAWAGDSSDRSRFLLQRLRLQRGHAVDVRFEPVPHLSVDRIPEIPPREAWTKPPLGTEDKPWLPRWNQGDLFCELADLDCDGRLDLILCSSDYPDPAPFDQRLRIFHQQEDGTFKDTTPESGIDHVGAQQLSLADLDGDGDLDIAVGQSYNRFDKSLIDSTNARQASTGPRMRVFLNQTRSSNPAPGQPSQPSALILRLRGEIMPANNGWARPYPIDPATPRPPCSTDAIGAIVRVTATIRGTPITQLRQLIGIGGCAGKQHEFILHFGLADAATADRVEIIWPNAVESRTILTNLPAGTHEFRCRD